MSIKNEFLKKISKVADVIIDFCSGNRIWLFVLALWAISVLFTTESHERSWFVFIPVFGVLMIVYLPTLIFVFFRKELKRQLPKVLFYGLSFLMFIGYPLVLILTDVYKFVNQTNVFSFHQGVHHNRRGRVFFFALREFRGSISHLQQRICRSRFPFELIELSLIEPQQYLQFLRIGFPTRKF